MSRLGAPPSLPRRHELLAALRECREQFGLIDAAHDYDVIAKLSTRGFELCVEILSKFPPEKIPGNRRNGGYARAAALTPVQRSAIASAAAVARWNKHKNSLQSPP